MSAIEQPHSDPNSHPDPVSIQEVIKLPLDQMSAYLAPYLAQIRETKIPDTYLVKFTQETKVDNLLVNQLRGLLYNHKSGQIYSMTYPVPIEVKDLSSEQQQDLLQHLSDQTYHVEEALDGTLMRLSYIDQMDKWYLSTNGKEDAHDAYWMNGQSFYDQFWSANQSDKIDLSKLDKRYVYLFLLCHPLNVIVINHREPKIYHVATYDRATLRQTDDNNLMQWGIPRPLTYQMTVKDVCQKITESKDTPVNLAGYMVVVTPDANGVVRRYRFENYNYTQARDLRGDSNNINYHILGLIQDQDQRPEPVVIGSTEPMGPVVACKSKLGEFLQYYPIYQTQTDSLYLRLQSLTHKLYQEYGLRYKKHQSIYVHPRHHRILYQIHTDVYLNKLKAINKTVQLLDIKIFLYQLPTAKLLYLLNYIYDQ